MVIADVLALGRYLRVRDTVRWFNSGRYRKRLASPGGELLGFVTLQELAEKLAVRPAVIQWWIARGRLTRSNGLVRCSQLTFVDIKKFKLKALPLPPITTAVKAGKS